MYLSENVGGNLNLNDVTMTTVAQGFRLAGTAARSSVTTVTGALKLNMTGVAPALITLGARYGIAVHNYASITANDVTISMSRVDSIASGP